MITYFHHINESRRDGRRFGGRHWFHHRWFWNTKKRGYRLEVSSGPALSFEFQRGEAGDGGNECMLKLGLLFFTIYFTFPLPSKFIERKKCVATWDNNRVFWLPQGRLYGFYFYQWAFVWSWHSKVHESSNSDPWWMHQYWHIDQWFLGRNESVRTNVGLEAKNIYFKIGEQEFKMDSIKWERVHWFRTFIPFALYNRKRHYVEMNIEKPPMRAGKGENSWDCGDDGTFGMHRSWEKPLPVPTWQNTDVCAKLAVVIYVKEVFKDAKRYGTAEKENRGFSLEDDFKYIGSKI
jgi:hypothetical protein